MNHRIALTGLLLASLAIGCQKEPPSEGEPLPPDTGPAAPGAYVSKPGRFSAVFPAPPEESSRDIIGEGVVTQHRAKLDAGDVVYSATCYVMQPGDEADLDADREANTPLGLSRLVRAARIERGGYEGREWEMEVLTEPKGYAVFRSYLVGRRVYKAYVWERDARAPSQRAMQFLDSFRMHK